MSDHAWRTGIAAALLCGAAAPAVARGQSVTELQRRVAILDARHAHARAVALRADSLRAERLDTVRAGPVIVLTPPTETAAVRAALGSAWPRIDSLYGDEVRLLLGKPFVFWRASRSPQPERPEHPGIPRIQVDSLATVEDIAWQAGMAVGLTVLSHADSTLVNWLNLALLPYPHSEAEFTRAYVDLITTPSRAARNCFLGDLGWCREVLGLKGSDDPLHRLYDAADRRALVAGLADAGVVRAYPAERDRCLVAQDDAACVKLLRMMPVAEPLQQEVRHSLARFALRLGGRDAYARLVHTAGKPLEQRLAAAARLSADSLLGAWRAHVIQARPQTVSLTPAMAWAALAWACLLGLVSLGSTRWR